MEKTQAIGGCIRIRPCVHVGHSAASAKSGILGSMVSVISALAIVALVFHIPAGSLLAQEDYSPDHPDVRAMADAAVGTLGGGANIGEATLGALAIVEHSKRYDQRVPRGNASVQNTIDRIVQMFPSNGSQGGDITEYSEVYFPALALILLAEFDDKKYSSEIEELLQMFVDRQRPNGTFTYLNQPSSSDTSQTQFAALAMSVAKSHDFKVNPDMGSRALDWLCDTQQRGGNWVYKFGANGAPLSSSTPTLSMQAAGASSVYLLADYLQLYPRAQNRKGTKASEDEGLPPTVGIYIKPADGNERVVNAGPLASFDRGKLRAVVAAGNTSFDSRFTPDLDQWGYYYLYAVERYAYFRDQAEGEIKNGSLATWYDQGVEFLKTKQQTRGSFSSARESNTVATAFAVLFLVRSSEIINFPPGKGPMDGGSGFDGDEVLRQAPDGGIAGLSTEQDLAEMLKTLGESGHASDEQLANITSSLKKQIAEFRTRDDKSRSEIKDFLRTMIGANSFHRRLVAVKFLAGEQDMDNVPALLLAVGDPNFKICLEAHDGLRLISRKLDTITISEEARVNSKRPFAVFKKERELGNRIRREYKSVKEEWTDWFLKIRPGAELLD